MKLKHTLVSAGLALTLGVCAFSAVSASVKDPQMARAHSAKGLTLITTSNLADYVGKEVVILSAKTGNPEYQWAWDGTGFSLDSTGELVHYTIGVVGGSKFTLYYGDSDHFLGETNGNPGFNKTSPTEYGLVGDGYIERPTYETYADWDPMFQQWNSVTMYPTMNMGWVKHSSGNAEYYYSMTSPAMMIDDTEGHFYLYSATPTHQHAFAYHAEGATITAICQEDDCPLENSEATLTLDAPTSLVYDGNAKAATIESGYNTEAFPNPVIKYYQGANEVSECRNAGTYQAKVTVGGATAVVEFTIAKANPVVWAPLARNATYGQSLSDVPLPDGWAWNSPSDKVGDAGVRSHKATYTHSDAANYNTVEADVEVNVAKADPQYEIPTGLTSLVNKTLSTIALPEGWSWVNPEENVGSTSADKAFKGTFTPEDTDNYNIVTNIDIPVKVRVHEHIWTYIANGASITASCSAPECGITEGLTITLLAPSGDMHYNGQPKVATVAAGYSPIVYSTPVINYYQGQNRVDECINAGTYRAELTYADATAVVEFTIEKAEPGVDEPLPVNATYGQSLSDLSLPDGWAWNSPSDKVGDAGVRTHKATYTPIDTQNYETIEADVEVNVAKANPQYVVPTGLTSLVNKTLSTIALPNGWAWDNPNESVGSIAGQKTFKGTYTPADTTNYNRVEHVDIPVLVKEHTHNWSYNANGSSITASCSAPDCEVREGLTLTLLAPSGDMHYDGHAKSATLQAGYSAEAFPNPVIKYFQGEKEVSECVNVGEYSAKVTFGGVTARVSFEILGRNMTDSDQSGVKVEIDNAVVDENIELRVEIRSDVVEKDSAADYAKIKEMLGKDQEISKVYDVKLIRNVNGVETEVQPSDIKEGLKIKVHMAIPEGINISEAKILHIHNVDDMEYLTDYKVEGSEVVFEIDKLSQFAFVTKKAMPSPAPAGNHGFCLGWVALIIDILFALVTACYLILRFKPFKLPKKLEDMSIALSKNEPTINLIACPILLANFVFDLLIVIIHQCPLSIVAMVLGLAIILSIAFCYVISKKQNKESLNGHSEEK